MFFIITLITFIASMIGTISGFGIGTLMTPVLLFFLPYQQTLFLVGSIHWVNSIWKIILFKKGISWHLFFLFGIPGVIASVIGALLSETGYILLPLLGIFLISYSFFIFFKPNFYIPQTNASLIIGGGITGLFAGIFGIRGAIRSMVLSAFNLPKEIYLGTTGAISLLVDTARLYVYWHHGATLALSYFMILILIALSFMGAYIGRIIVDYIPQQTFRIVVVIFLLLMGIRLIIMPLL
jgi:uncharacterized protein